MQEIVNKLSSELNLPPKVIEEIYRSYWYFIKNKISSLSLKDVKDEKEFNNLRTNFNIPNIGKLSCSYKEWLTTKNNYKRLTNGNKDKKDKASV